MHRDIGEVWKEAIIHILCAVWWIQGRQHLNRKRRDKQKSHREEQTFNVGIAWKCFDEKVIDFFLNYRFTLHRCCMACWAYPGFSDFKIYNLRIFLIELYQPNASLLQCFIMQDTYTCWEVFIFIVATLHIQI